MQYTYIFGISMTLRVCPHAGDIAHHHHQSSFKIFTKPPNHAAAHRTYLNISVLVTARVDATLNDVNPNQISYVVVRSMPVLRSCARK